MHSITIFTLLCGVFLLGINGEAQHTKIVRARLESCPGCQLNRLPDVKAFVYEDIPKYDNTEFKKIQGAPPELLFLNEDDEVVEKHSLKSLSREECNKLLQDRGFTPRGRKEL